ncbi:MAG: GDSL-type esterase/lipase family protein [Chitinophagales bacterium]|nr:GDSL-type esterase/lipase family protein [Chitinophagales bacterium]
MKYLSKCLYIIFIIILLEILGWGLLRLYSTNSDFISNQNYNKIRAMLIANNNEQTVSKYIQVPYLTYIPNPLYTKEGYTQHNISGYRGTEIPLKKSNKFRILCLGGSTTYGTGVDNPSDSYPAQLEKILNKSLLQETEVINAGLEAGTSAEELVHYLLKFRYYHPDLVIIHSGGNDAMIVDDSTDFQLDYTHYRKLKFSLEPASQLIRCLLHSRLLSFLLIRTIYSPLLNNSGDMFSEGAISSRKIAHWTNAEVVKRSSDYTFNPFYQNHTALIKNIQLEGTKVIDLTFGFDTSFYLKNNMKRIMENVISNNSTIEKCSKELEINLIKYSYSDISEKYFWLDDCHITKEGEKEKAQLIADFIIENNLIESE